MDKVRKECWKKKKEASKYVVFSDCCEYNQAKVVRWSAYNSYLYNSISLQINRENGQKKERDENENGLHTSASR